MKTIRRPYDKRTQVQYECTDPSRTHQSFKQECDINNVLNRYNKTGQLPQLIKENPQYGDFSQMEEFQESLNTVQKAHEQFELLPARTRERFMNDPARFLAFATNPANMREMVQLGLATEVITEPKPEPLKSKGKPKDEKAPDKDA